MSRRLRLALVGVVGAALVGCAPLPSVVGGSPGDSSTGSAPALGCPADPDAHVYHAYRLHLLASCVTVSGIIESAWSEPDGDLHVRLRLDPGQTCAGQTCINVTNVAQQRGDLVLEPVCEEAVSQADAVDACLHYHSTLVVPPVGSHVAATGPWVIDTDHGWEEIHPLEAIRAA